MTIRSSSFSPVYNTNPETDNLLVELVGINTEPINNSNSNVVNIASSNTSITLLEENLNRTSVIIINDSLADLYIVFNNSVASSTNHTILLKGKPTINDSPSYTTFTGNDYTGQVNGKWESANGFARITEVIGTSSSNSLSGSGSSSTSTNPIIKKYQIEFEEAPLTQPGTTLARDINGCVFGLIQVDITNINTSVTIRIEASNNNTTWFNLNSLDTNTTITSNKSEVFRFNDCPRYVRVNFVSEMGGTNAIINVFMRFSA